MELQKYYQTLNSNGEFQKAFLVELGKHGYLIKFSDGETQRLRPGSITPELLWQNFQIVDLDRNIKYQWSPDDGILDADGENRVDLYPAFAAIDAEKAFKTAEAVLDLNEFGFSNNELKSPNPKNPTELFWDFNKFKRKLVQNLEFINYEVTLSNGDVERKLYQFTPEKGYERIGVDQINSILQKIGVPDSWIVGDNTVGKLEKLIKNSPEIQPIYEWNVRLIPCKNGVLDPWTLELRPHRAEDCVKHRMVCDWNTAAEHPMADKIFDDIPDEKDRSMVKMMLATTLVGNLNRNFFVQKGVTGTGKSTITELWRDCVLGKNLTTTFFAQQSFGTGDSARFGLIRFDTAFMALCDDLTKERIKDSGVFKTATAGGTVSIQYKGKDSYDAKARAVIIINANAVPNFEDREGAILDRAVFIDRDFELPKEMRKDFNKYINNEDFKSRLLTIVMEEFQKHIVQDEDGLWTFKLPEESDGGKKLRQAAQQSGISIRDSYEELFKISKVVGMPNEDLKDDITSIFKEKNMDAEPNPIMFNNLSNALHSIPMENGVRLQIVGGKVIKLPGAKSVRVPALVAFSSLDGRREQHAEDAIRYWALCNYTKDGKNIAGVCANVAIEKDEKSARACWQKYEDAYNRIINIVRNISTEDCDLVPYYILEEGDPRLTFEEQLQGVMGI